MKKLLLLLTCSGTMWATAQNNVNITPTQYNQLKQSGQLDVSKKYNFPNSFSTSPITKPSEEILTSRGLKAMCSCMVPLDSTFSVVPFVHGAYDSIEYRNDDGYTDLIGLPFSFNFYGVNYDSLYINNNGNISFLNPYYEYTPDSFPTYLYNMIAAFWGDVDTRNSMSGLVYYKITPTALIVKWENVGYYNMYSDKLNTFQLIITDGTDSLLPAGNNVGFCYGDMSWTTGDASGGVNGFFGSPATVGVNQGNGTDYFQVGRFDQPGLGFDGPYNTTDSVDFLDNQEMYFNLASTGNIPPLVINQNICDTIDVYTGDTLRAASNFVMFKISTTTPEINQTVNASFSCSEPGRFSYVMTANTPTYKEYECTFITDNLPQGLYTVTVIATDNGLPSLQTSETIVIKAGNEQVTGIKESKKSDITLYPNPTDGIIHITHPYGVNSQAKLSLVNILGAEVATKELNSDNSTIDISNLPKGVYFATINSNEGKSKSFKVVYR